ncbi:MAG: hypothetical protein N3A66_03730 [Planctomycetota bacterium]|nr:hypothetical protein [Planctomycetota bacterium]
MLIAFTEMSLFQAWRLALAFAGALLLFATSPRAGEEVSVNDEVVLHTKSGGRVEGVLAKSEASFVEIKTRFGPQRIARGDIARIEKGVTAETLFKKKRKAIGDADGKSLLDLAKWCEEQGLWQEAVATYLETMEVAGPHFIEAETRLAALAMNRKDYRLAVECYRDLAVRLMQPEARDALRG